MWKDLTAMDYHYETQPLPNPISYFLHHAPKKFHRCTSAHGYGRQTPIPSFMASWLSLRMYPARALFFGRAWDESKLSRPDATP